MTSYEYMVGRVLSHANQNVSKDKKLEKLVDLEPKLQLLSFKLIWLAFKNVIAEQVKYERDIVLPYIGSLRLKGETKILLKYRQQILKELGYNDWGEIPIDKLKECKDKAYLLAKDEIIEYKKLNKGKRRANHQMTPKSTTPITKVFNVNFKRKT